MTTKTRAARPRPGARLWLLLVVVGCACSAVPAILAGSGALGIQVLGAAAGAAVFTGGFGLGGAGWPRRRQSELHRLAVASGFLMCCVGLFMMVAGIGLYH